MTNLVMTATSITPQQACDAARKFVSHNVTLRNHAKHITIQQVKPYAIDDERNASVYAVNFSNNDGFVLVGSIDQHDNIIGYCDHGTFDTEQLPPNMRAWLDSYIKNARRSKNNESSHSLLSTSHYPTKSAIAPMLKCKWNQDAPYNDQCPMFNGKHAPTGCTITAMAQIMYYHRCPTVATSAIPAYTPNNSSGTNYPALAALEPTTFDWDKIYPTYENNEDGSEVARLNKYLGTAAKTNYSENSSAATGYEALNAVIKYFGYDASGYALWRKQLTYGEWIDTLYAELQAKRPILFSGTSPDNAHSFIVDGYSEEDYFHVNWGWGGTSDGYYRVVFMDPKDQGLGGSEGNEAYTSDQVAFFNVKPNDGGSLSAMLTVLDNWLYTDPQGTGEFETHDETSTSTFIQGHGYLVYPVMNSFNHNAINGEFALGCRLVKNDGSVTRDYEWASANFDANSGLDNHSYILYLNPLTDPALTDGQYKLHFISKLKNADTWQLDNDSEDHYIDILLNHSNGKLTATSVSRKAKLTVKGVKIDTPVPTAGQTCDVTITLHNEGDNTYHGDLYLSSNKNSLSIIACDVKPSETVDVKMSFTPKNSGVINYTIEDINVSELYNGTITVAESNTTSNLDLTITHNVTNAVGTIIPAPRALIDVTVTNNNDKTYKGEISIYCFKWTGSEYKFVYKTKEETIPAHQTVVLHRESPNLTGAECYSFTTMYMKGDEQIQQDAAPVYYTTASYILTYDADGVETTHLVNDAWQPDATVCAVDLTNAPSVTSVNTSANPNMMVIAGENSSLTGDNIIKGTQAQNVKLTHGYPFYCPITFTASHISYTRTPQLNLDSELEKGWSTLVLPFAATSCQATINGEVTPLQWYTANTDGDIMVTTCKYENGSEMEFSVPESTLLPNHPYLLGIPATTHRSQSLVNVPITFSAHDAEVSTAAKAVVTGLNYKMVGTMIPLTNMENIYVFNTDGSAFVAGTTVNSFNAYFAPIGSQVPATTLTIKLTNGSLSGINEIISNESNNLQGPCYNINGQRVTRPAKGIHILNGKKVIF